VAENDKERLIRMLKELKERMEELGDATLDPPPAWLPREKQDEIREALTNFKVVLRECLPANATARAFLDSDELN